MYHDIYNPELRPRVHNPLIFFRGGILPGRLVTNTREGAARSLLASSPFPVANETSRAPLTCRPCVTSRDFTQMGSVFENYLQRGEALDKNIKERVIRIWLDSYFLFLIMKIWQRKCKIKCDCAQFVVLPMVTKSISSRVCSVLFSHLASRILVVGEFLHGRDNAGVQSLGCFKRSQQCHQKYAIRFHIF